MSYSGKVSGSTNAGPYETAISFTYGSDIEADLSNFAVAKTQLDQKKYIFEVTSNVPQNLKTSLAEYVRSGGISTQTTPNAANPLYQNVYNSWSNTNIMLKGYQNISKSMTDALSKYNGLTSSQSSAITSIGANNIIINKLNKKLQESQTDLDIATSRQDSIKNASADQSYMQGFSGYIGFTRPLKPTSVALLMGLGFFIFFVTCLILKDYFSTSADIASQFFSLNEMIEKLSSNTSRSVMIGVIATFVLYAAGLYVYFYVYQ